MRIQGVRAVLEMRHILMAQDNLGQKVTDEFTSWNFAVF